MPLKFGPLFVWITLTVESVQRYFTRRLCYIFIFQNTHLCSSSVLCCAVLYIFAYHLKDFNLEPLELRRIFGDLHELHCIS